MKDLLKSILKYFVLSCIGGWVYVTIEMMYRGRSDVSMMYCGSICFIACGLLNKALPWKMPLWIQCIICAFCIITPVEYLFGILFNQDYSVWDYRNIPFNINGQICLPFTLLWIIVAILPIVLDDYFRYWLFDEQKPEYHFIWNKENK